MSDGISSYKINQVLFPVELLLYQRKIPMITAKLIDSIRETNRSTISPDFVT